jgi:hypothetical protein
MNHWKLRDVKRDIQRWDEQREGIPGEHWMALAAGVAVWIFTRSRRNLPIRLLGAVAGTLLVTRALSGREALGKRVSWLPRMH